MNTRRNLPLIALGALLISLGSLGAGIDIGGILEVTSNVYGTYAGDENPEEVTIHIDYGPSQSYSLVYERLTIYHLAEILQVIRFESHGLTRGDNYSLSFQFPIQALKDYKKLDFQFSIITGTGKTLFDGYTHLNVANQGEYRLKDLEDKQLTFKNSGLKFSGDMINGVDETFNFGILDDYFHMNEYFKIDFNDLLFQYNFPNDLTYKNAYLEYEDIHNAFPFLHERMTNIVRFKLGLRQEDSMISFYSNDTYYVETKTKILHRTMVNKSKKTQDIYLPIGYRDALDKERLSLHIVGLGANKIHVVQPITLYTGKYYFGKCDESEYCVIGDLSDE